MTLTNDFRTWVGGVGLELAGGKEASFVRGATFNFRASHATKIPHYFFLYLVELSSV